MKRAILWVFIMAMGAGRLAWAADAGVKTDSFDSAGVKISYMVAGEGEPVILVHGLYASAATNWKLPGTFDELAKHHKVVALDLRGHGQSDKPADDASYGQPMVDDVLRLMDHLKIEKAHIVGYSLGGIVAMKFMIDHPDRVLTGTLGGMGWLKAGSFQQASFERMSGRDASRTPPACVHGIAKLAVTEDKVKSVKAPLHVLVGSRDPCEKLYVEPLKKIRSDVEVTPIEGAGHITCVMNAQFKEELAKWIDKHGVAAADEKKPQATDGKKPDVK